MAGEFLRSHGIDIDAEMSRIQNEPTEPGPAPSPFPQNNSSELVIRNVSLPKTSPGSRWDVSIQDGKISDISSQDLSQSSSRCTHGSEGALLTPSLCHPHIHLDKAFLLSHPKYAHLQLERGDFSEAMDLTGEAKSLFEHDDLLERGQRVIDESIAAGVTHMRAFIEVDSMVGMKCLDAGIELKKGAAGRCEIQLCAFAQLPLLTTAQGDEGGEKIRELMREAASMSEIEAVGSTPYVEGDREKMERNVAWMIELSKMHGKHLDFHLDYNLDLEIEPMVWYVIRTLTKRRWIGKTEQKTVVLGHCTRLTLFSADEWQRLRDEIGNLPISFVGLPTSDLFMMPSSHRTRGSLDAPRLIKDYGLNACIGVNNIGNAFTPYGSCDPLSLACNGVGIYQAGTKHDAEILFECVSTRAKSAIGYGSDTRKQDKDVGKEDLSIGLKTGDKADLLLFGSESQEWRTRKGVAEAVYLYDQGRGRRAFLVGEMTSVE